MAYQLWVLKPGVDPEECDYDDAWIWGRVITRCRREVGMGQGKSGRAQLQQQSESWAMPRRGRRYHWDPKVRWYRLAEVDGERVENGPLLDMNFGELDRQMQAPFERDETSARRRPRHRRSGPRRAPS